MIFSLDVLRARKGDCLLLHFGTQDEPGLVMIDGGPSQVYGPHLRPRIIEIRRRRELEDTEPLDVDILMVSHVDDDHIKGILDLMREVEDTNEPNLHFAQMWHNSFDDVIGNDPARLNKVTSSVSGFGAAALANELPKDLDELFDDDSQREVAVDTMKVLASIAQGHELRGFAKRMKIPLNTDFVGTRKMAMASAEVVEVSDEVEVLIAGPRKSELKELQKKHDEWLQEQKDKAGPAALAAYVDKSVPNLSSIVGLVRCGEKSLLLTGDARGDNILRGLEEVGAVEPGGRLDVDILKVPHHGSSNNLDNDFFERIVAKHYVFSGNGEHGNPERESIEMLLDARGGDAFTIHLTYPVEEIDVERKKNWEKDRKAKTDKGKPDPGRWNPAEQGLVELFEQRPLNSKQKLAIVPAAGPHVIDLLDPLGF